MARPRKEEKAIPATKIDTDKMITVKIIPLGDYQNSQYVKIFTGEFIGARMLPFDKKVKITKKELQALERMKYITRNKEKMTVKDIMEKYRVSKELAESMLKEGVANKKAKTPKQFEIVRY